jgi:hypothetical protein
MLEASHKPSIRDVTLVGVTEAQALAELPKTIRGLTAKLGPGSLPCLAPWTSLKTLELKLHADFLAELEPIAVEWELQTLALELDGSERDKNFFQVGFAETQVRKSKFNAFVISLIEAPSSFNTLRDIEISYEDLDPEFYSAPNDLDVLVALSSLSRTRELEQVKLPIQPFVFPEIWATSVLLVCESGWDIRGRVGYDFPDAHAWLSQVKAQRLVMFGQDSAIRPITIPKVAELGVAYMPSQREDLVLFRELGFSFGSVMEDLVVLNVETTVLDESSVLTITQNCPNLCHISIGAHCVCEEIAGHKPGQVIAEIIAGLSKLKAIKLTSDNIRVRLESMLCLQCLYLPSLLGTIVWETTGLEDIAVEGFDIGIEEARKLIPLSIDFEAK